MYRYSAWHGVERFEEALETWEKAIAHSLLRRCGASLVSDARPAVSWASASALCHRKRQFGALLLTPL